MWRVFHGNVCEIFKIKIEHVTLGPTHLLAIEPDAISSSGFFEAHILAFTEHSCLD